MNAKGILAFIGGIAIGAAAGILLAPEKGEETRAKIIDYLKEKGVSRDKFDDIIAKVKTKLSKYSSMEDIETAVDEALKS